MTEGAPISRRRRGEDVLAVLLAGGRSARMGGRKKSLIPLAGRSLLDRVIDRIGGQVSKLVLSANDASPRMRAYGYPVLTDAVDGFAGPLAGIVSAMAWARENAPDIAWIATVPTDTPFLPLDLVAKLRAAATRADADVACAASGGRMHPVCGVWRVALAEDMYTQVVNEGLRKVESAVRRRHHVIVEFPVRRYDPFFNVNTPEDVGRAERILGNAEKVAGTQFVADQGRPPTCGRTP